MFETYHTSLVERLLVYVRVGLQERGRGKREKEKGGVRDLSNCEGLICSLIEIGKENKGKKTRRLSV